MGPNEQLRAVPDRMPDNVARWEQLRFTYPEARHVFEDGWYYGSLRDTDDVLRAASLGVLIDRLTAREQDPGAAPV